MHAHYLQHVPFEGLGSIEPWLKKSGYTITRTSFFESDELPDIHEFDFLIILGGPMSVNDEAQFPWLIKEKEFIRRAIEEKKAIFGVCLGAQLIACAEGARIYPNKYKEIGWFPVQGVPQKHNSVFSFPSSMNVFHWHGETFDLPPGAVCITRSEGCENQGFQLGPSIIGLQFHLETTPASARDIVTHCRDELIPNTFVQSEEQILNAPSENYHAINLLMDDILTFLTRNDD